VLCQRTLSASQADFFAEAISENYHNNWLMDGLPAGSISEVSEEYTGFPVGVTEWPAPVDVAVDNTQATAAAAARRVQPKPQHYLYNHVNIVVDYHSISADGHRIVGFFIEPISVEHELASAWDGHGEAPTVNTCPTMDRLKPEDVKKRQRVKAGPVLYTYGVQWRPSDLRWASRWDLYLDSDREATDRIQWFSITNSIAIVLLMAGLVGYITYKNISGEITEYNKPLSDEEKQEQREESGWKLLHADVFRPPAESDSPLMFAALVGSGVQLFMCAFVGLGFSAAGFISPTNRGSLMLGMLLVFVLTGSFAGFASARLYKTFRGRQWQRCTLITATFFPGICFALFFVLNFLVWVQGSTGAVPVSSMLIMLFLWFGVSVPLVFCGAYYGYKKDPLAFPTVTSSVARAIPEVPWYLEPWATAAIGGILPFSACFVQLFFVMSSIWTDKYVIVSHWPLATCHLLLPYLHSIASPLSYILTSFSLYLSRYFYVFGFMFVAFLILTVTCAEIAIVMTYLQLCREDHRWWWRSVQTAGACACYVFLYSILYFFRLQSNYFVTYCLYFGYMGLVSLAVFLTCGTVGFFASLYFNVQIYASIKVD
jgi:transmembrane 9 superfamily protein 2/4